MALIKCYECGASISDKASVCPHCGAPVQIENQNAADKEEIKVDNTLIKQQTVIDDSSSKKKSKKSFAVVGAVIGVLAIVGIVVFVLLGNRKASDEKIRKEAENLLDIAKMSGAEIAIGGAGRDEGTGVAKVLYVVKYEGTSHDFYLMDDSEKAALEDSANELLKTLSGNLEDALKEEVAVGINIVSSPGTYEFLGRTIHADSEVVAEYYDYGSDERNEQIRQAAADQQEADYNQLVELAKEKKYDEATSFYGSSSLNSDYKDASKYYEYARIMKKYTEMTCYGKVYQDIEENCADILDAADVMKEIEDKVFYLDGVYKNESLDWGMYMCIYHGMVAVEMAVDTAPTEIMYFDTLMDYEFTTGKKAYAFGDSYDGTASYVIEEIEGGKLLVAAAPGGSTTAYSGVYKKVSSNPAKPK